MSEYTAICKKDTEISTVSWWNCNLLCQMLPDSIYIDVGGPFRDWPWSPPVANIVFIWVISCILPKSSMKSREWLLLIRFCTVITRGEPILSGTKVSFQITSNWEESQFIIITLESSPHNQKAKWEPSVQFPMPRTSFYHCQPLL